MYKTPKFILFFFILLSSCLFLDAQAQSKQQHTDHKPVYRKWKDDYILDKIEYTENRTIFYFRFVCKSGAYTSAIFYPPGGDHPWYLKGRNIRKNFPLRAIKNVKRNDVLIASSVRRRALSINALDNGKYTVFSCEVHFDRLPNNLKTVDLIEGRGQEHNVNHFNCFNVKLKTWDDEELGTKEDSEESILAFEEKFEIEPKPKPDPKPEPKPDPKPEPKPDPKPDTKPEIKPEDRPEVKEKIRDNLVKYEDIDCGKTLRLDKIKFYDNSANFMGMVQAKQIMRMIKVYLQNHPKSKVVLHGYTDVFGDPDRNLALSKKRVKKIQKWLVQYGVGFDQIELKWYGSKNPIVPEGSPLNRRVEVSITCE